MLGFSKSNSFKLSKPLFAILTTTVILAILLAIGTIRNLRREQQIMQSFLLDEGLTLIRSFEAGARTTMQHPMMTEDSRPLVTLVKETAKTDRIAYISIITEDGTVVASAGGHNIAIDQNITTQVLKTQQPITVMVPNKDKAPIFEVATIFQTLPSDSPPMMGMMGRHHFRRKTPQTIQLEEGRAVIHLGLYTEEFIKASQQDITHSLFMGGLLVLVGSAGFYFLFLYQGMQVTRATLANMKLYTQNIIESMPDGLLTLDSRSRIVSCNPRALEFTKMDLAELKGKRPEDLFADWPADSRHTQGTAFSYTFVHQDGTQVPVEISSSPLLDDQGNTLGAVFLLRDLRSIRSMQNQLDRARRLAALGKMAAGIAHEIRNPLGTLRGFAQYFGAKADDDAAREYSALMIGEVDRLNESISSLLQFSRPRDPEFSPIDPRTLLDKTVKLLEYDFREKNIHLQKDDHCAQSIEADEDLLLQVLLNLLKNSINAGPNGATIELSCHDDGNNIRITVADNGKGMNQTEQSRMFDPFFTTRTAGTGLGLAVSHQIVEQHDGHFEITSQPGKGTSITIILPKQHTTHPTVRRDAL